MFAGFNIDNFPIVIVTFSESIHSEEEFNQFLIDWTCLPALFFQLTEK